MSVAQISLFPLATLKLRLDHYHLPHGSVKKVVAKCLFDHLQSCRESSNDEESESSNEEESDDNSSASSVEEEEDEANTGSDAAAEVDTHSSPTQTPSSEAQRQALQETVRSLMRDESGHHRRHHTISPSRPDPLANGERLIAISTRGVAAPSENVACQAPPPPPPVPLPVVAPVHPATAPLPQTSHRMAGGSIASAVITIAAESLATPLAVAGAIAMAGARTLTSLFYVS